MIGFVAYPWQKAQDRKNERHRELREFYFQTVSELVELRGSLARGPQLTGDSDISVTAENWVSEILPKVNVIVGRVFLVSEDQKTLDAAMKMQRVTLDFLRGYSEFALTEFGTKDLDRVQLREIATRYWHQARKGVDEMHSELESAFVSEVQGHEVKITNLPLDGRD
ncbi:hypothetical protein [Thioclava electrotropha]|uniref:Uncharacterized protein n=1 Tax=Thioclava electrotropha TaxID=1549850 RepID=A0ABX6YYP7_9RHOB|nr:hypothetical protein [Thioclava electrotropha]QPZ92399.1 hypothetical protein AKL02_016855 [Thioclava electrotropha]